MDEHCCCVDFPFDFRSFLRTRQPLSVCVCEQKYFQLGDFGHDCPTASIPVCAPPYEIQEWINILVEQCGQRTTKGKNRCRLNIKWPALSFGNFLCAAFVSETAYILHKHTRTRKKAKRKPMLRSRRMLQAYAAKWTERRRKKFQQKKAKKKRK